MSMRASMGDAEASLSAPGARSAVRLPHPENTVAHAAPTKIPRAKRCAMGSSIPSFPGRASEHFA